MFLFHPLVMFIKILAAFKTEWWKCDGDVYMEITSELNV